MDDIFTHGIKAKRLEEKKNNRRDRIKRIIERCKKDLEEVKKEEKTDMNEFMDNIPWNDIDLWIRQFSNDDLI